LRRTTATRQTVFWENLWHAGSVGLPIISRQEKTQESLKEGKSFAIEEKGSAGHRAPYILPTRKRGWSTRVCIARAQKITEGKMSREEVASA